MIEVQILKIFNKIMRTKIKKISINQKLNSKTWDSLNHIRLISELEKKFKIVFGYEEINSMNNLKTILKIIKKSKKNRDGN